MVWIVLGKLALVSFAGLIAWKGFTTEDHVGRGIMKFFSGVAIFALLASFLPN